MIGTLISLINKSKLSQPRSVWIGHELSSGEFPKCRTAVLNTPAIPF